jgi:hypothetical protein
VSPNVTFTAVPDGTVDLLGGISALVGAGTIVPTRLFIRRGLNPAGGSAINDIDFNGADGFAAQVNNLTLNNIGGGEQVLQTTQLRTANGSALVGQVLGPTTTTNWYGVPAAGLIAGDLHILNVLATQPVALAPQRSILRMVAAPANLTLTLGPTLSAPNVVGLAASGYSRARAEYPIQTEYDRFWFASFAQGQPGNTRQTQIQMTKAYRGSGEGTTTLEVPNFDGVLGWLSIWGLRPGNQLTWTVTATGWAAQGGVIQPPFADGNTAFTATRFGQLTP